MTGLLSVRNHRALFRILMLSVFIAALFFIWWTVLRGDRELRTDLLQQARLVAHVMGTDFIKTLSGTDTDLDKPEYWRITEQTKAACSVNTGWRWLYLMGRRSDGTVFFYLDSEAAGSKDHAFPGQVYGEASEPFHTVFDTGCPLVDGPYSDHWGTWVSALIPVSDPKTGAVLAVLGVNIDARSWYWNVAARTAIPIGLIFFVIIIAVSVFVASRKVDVSPKPVMRRLLPPLASMVILMMAGAGALLWRQYQMSIREISVDTSDISKDLRNSIGQEADSMTASIQLIASEPTVKKALRERDADSLLAVSRPIFEILGKNAHISHFYFSDTNRVCLLRVHKPNERGDTISRFTAIKAEATGKSASGIEMGPLGTLTLRVVLPVFEDGILIGYMELGKEIGELLNSLNTRPNIKLALVIHKKFLNRLAWEESMRLIERQSDWDRLPNNVVVYASKDLHSDVFTSWLNQTMEGENARHETNREIVFGGKNWALSSIPLTDASGKNVVSLLIMENLTSGKAAFASLLIFGGICGTVLLALLLAFVYVLLRSTDAGIRADQETLREERQHLNDTIKAANLGTWEWNVQTGETVFNDLWAKIIGYSLDEISPVSIETWLKFTHPDDLKLSSELLEKYFRGELDHYECIARMRHKDDNWVQILVHGKVTAWTEDGKPLLMRGIHTDITAHKRMEKLLSETNSYLENLITYANAPIIVWDPQFRITRFNHAFEILSGRSEADVVNRPLEILFPPEFIQDSMVLIRATATGERWKTVEIKILHSEKSVRTVLWNSATLFAADGRTPIATIAQGYDITERQRLEADIEKTISSYRKFVPHQMLNLLGKESITDVEVGDQVEKDLTILFSDIRDFTAMTEVFTPKESFNFINSYLRQMETLVSAHNGVIDKFIGDAIMAIFPESAEDALNCSLSMLQQLDKFNEERKTYGHPPVNIGIGLNTGLCMLGTVGGFNRMQGTVIGDAVNISSRLESETKKYGVHLLIGENTYYGISDIGRHNIRFIDRVLVKGKSRPQSVYEVFDNDPAEVKKLKNETKLLFEEALAHYHYKKIDAAKAMLEKCIMINPGDNPAKFYLERCKVFAATGIHEGASELNQKLEWNSEFEAGIPETDRQHQGLFNISTQLLDKVGFQDKEKEIDKIVSFLDDYILIHFKTEEKIMSDAGYPFLKHQQEQHVRFIVNFKQLKGEIEEHRLSSTYLMFRIQVFLIDWLLNHTMNKDRHFARYLKSKETAEN
jgi:hemerythrin-like metal-binding protein/PAS domain S-box-containing protein